MSDRTKSVLLQTGSSEDAVRAPEDYYGTPTWAVEELFKREEFNGQGWEPACGDGQITKVMERVAQENSDPAPWSSDYREDNIYGDGGKNFFFEFRTCDYIITNPPFNRALRFCQHSLNCASKVAMFVRLQFLEGKERHKFFQHHPPIRIHVFSERVGCIKGDKEFAAGIMCFAWFVWERGHSGPPAIHWILRGATA